MIRSSGPAKLAICLALLSVPFASSRAGATEGGRYEGFHLPFMEGFPSSPRETFSTGEIAVSCSIHKKGPHTVRLEFTAGLSQPGRQNLMIDRRNRAIGECRQQLLGPRKGQRKCKMKNRRTKGPDGVERLVFSFLARKTIKYETCRLELPRHRIFLQFLVCPGGVLEIHYFSPPDADPEVGFAALKENSC